MNKEFADILMDFLKISSEKKMVFTYQTGVKKNYVEFRDDEVIVNVYDVDDPNLNDYLNEKLKELNSIVPC